MIIKLYNWLMDKWVELMMPSDAADKVVFDLKEKNKCTRVPSNGAIKGVDMAKKKKRKGC